LLRLRKILLSNYTYLILIIIFIPIITIQLLFQEKQINNGKIKIVGIITKMNDSNITITNKKEYICYISNSKYNLGDKVEVKGELKDNIIFVSNIKLLSKNKNIYYKIKQIIISLLDNNPYLYTFIIGDKSRIDKQVLTSYQNNGISHLFAISGMHITLLSSIILKLLKKVSENKRYLVTSIFLIIYLLICNPSPSILRGVLFFIFFSINKIYYFYIKPINIFILVVIITLLINPNYLFNIGFQYSFTISFFLLLLSNKLESNNYFISLLKVSILSFIVSIPISLYHFNQINILGIILNLFFVPLISLIIFPLSLIVLIFKPLTPLYNLLIIILEKTSLLFNNIKLFTFIFPTLPIIIYLLYYLVIILIIKNKKIIILLILLLLIHYNLPLIINNEIMYILDIGQGDSILIRSNNITCLIDTGGSINSNYHISNKVTLPILKKLGIRKINKMYLTHGDYDHLGEALNIIENIKVDKIYLNSNKLNHNEKKLLKYHPTKLKENSITTCGNMTLYQLNTTFEDENDSSLVLLGIYNNKTFLFMGDASIKTEEYLLNNYDLPHINYLKVGHHGSKTSTSEELLKTIKPNIALISVGKDNKFKHPNKETIDKLNKYKVKIYRTDQDGNIMLNIKNRNILKK